MLEHEPRESRLMAEAMSTAVTCAGALLSWLVVIGGFMLIPFTAGTSAVISFIGQGSHGGQRNPMPYWGGQDQR